MGRSSRFCRRRISKGENIDDGAPKKKISGIKWDEEGIAEDDLERGTRQIIDEPKTPY